MPKRHKTYRRKTITIDSDKSYFEKYPTITLNRYWVPKAYLDAVTLTIQLYRDGVSFNRSVDQAHAIYPALKRNKVAEHALKTIANDY